MMSLDEIFIDIDTHHYSEPCTDESEIDDFAQRNNYQLPEDVKAFYRRHKTVRLFESEFGARYRFVPISAMHPTRLDIFGPHSDEKAPETWLTVCDVQDSNYIALDIASRDGDTYNYIDCFHETFGTPGESKIIAKSFTELLMRALQGGGDQVYYLRPGFAGYGDGLPLTPETAAHRIDLPDNPAKNGWSVQFSFKGAYHFKFFGDQAYGGKQQAFEAVKQYIRVAQQS